MCRKSPPLRLLEYQNVVFYATSSFFAVFAVFAVLAGFAGFAVVDAPEAIGIKVFATFVAKRLSFCPVRQSPLEVSL